MVILGLTGSIAMGKSTAAATFRRFGLPVYDADRAVHRLLGRGGAAMVPIAKAFPGIVKNGAVDRQALGKLVFNDKMALARLERIIHPLVRATKEKFLRRQAARRARIVVLDIPLLFETDGEWRCDAVVVVSASSFLQAHRAIGRAGMTAERLAGVLRRQMPDWEKRRRADFVVETGIGKRHSLRSIARIVKVMRGRRGRRWPPRVRRRRRPVKAVHA